MKRKRKIRILAACILSGLILRPQGAEATLITIQIEAVVDSVSDEGKYLEGKIKAGDSITGFYTYDSSTVDSEPLGYAGLYEHDSAPAGISLSVGGFDFRTDPDNVDFVVAIVNDSPPSEKDQVWMRSYNNLPLSNGIAVDGISWQLDDPTGTAISSTDLPTGPLVLHDWESVFGLGLYGDRMWGIDATVTSAELIPEPATLLLLSFGGTILARTRLRKR